MDPPGLEKSPAPFPVPPRLFGTGDVPRIGRRPAFFSNRGAHARHGPPAPLPGCEIPPRRAPPRGKRAAPLVPGFTQKTTGRQQKAEQSGQPQRCQPALDRKSRPNALETGRVPFPSMGRPRPPGFGISQAPNNRPFVCGFPRSFRITPSPLAQVPPGREALPWKIGPSARPVFLPGGRPTAPVLEKKSPRPEKHQEGKPSPAGPRPPRPFWQDCTFLCKKKKSKINLKILTSFTLFFFTTVPHSETPRRGVCPEWGESKFNSPGQTKTAFFPVFSVEKNYGGKKQPHGGRGRSTVNAFCPPLFFSSKTPVPPVPDVHRKSSPRPRSTPSGPESAGPQESGTDPITKKGPRPKIGWAPRFFGPPPPGPPRVKKETFPKILGGARKNPTPLARKKVESKVFFLFVWRKENPHAGAGPRLGKPSAPPSSQKNAAPRPKDSGCFFPDTAGEGNPRIKKMVRLKSLVCFVCFAARPERFLGRGPGLT